MRPGILLLLPLLLGGCEPERGVRATRDLAAPVDIACVDRALRQAFGKVERWDYVSDGGDFPEGSEVAQLVYYQTADMAGRAALRIAAVGSGSRVAHDFTGIGAELPQQAFPPAIAAMDKAKEVVRGRCGVDLSGMKLRPIGQEVDALD